MLPEDRLARVKAEPQGESGGEAVGRVEVLEAERKCRERKNRVDGVPAVVDPSTQLRTVPWLFESATPTSRLGMPNPRRWASRRHCRRRDCRPLPRKHRFHRGRPRGLLNVCISATCSVRARLGILVGIESLSHISYIHSSSSLCLPAYLTHELFIFALWFTV
ncbi:hypothetical protein FB451DRAFT_1572483 [Mycena latifolia]|nr:hypothetical protein FB451DRAFT_1572483 [Mycena latifolia]